MFAFEHRRVCKRLDEIKETTVKTTLDKQQGFFFFNFLLFFFVNFNKSFCEALRKVKEILYIEDCLQKKITPSYYLGEDVLSSIQVTEDELNEKLEKIEEEYYLRDKSINILPKEMFEKLCHIQDISEVMELRKLQMEMS